MESFVARQPIFDYRLNVFAYELLFRSGFDDVCSTIDKDKASSDVLTTTFILAGLEELTSGKKAAINFTRTLLLDEVATLFPSHLLLIEILETAEPDARLVDACKNLKSAGYRLLLDDFGPEDLHNPLLECVEIVKVDFSKTPPKERESIPRILGTKTLRFLAEKVETVEDFNQALKWNYSFFQGYFFSKPVIRTYHTIPGSNLVYFRLLDMVNRPDVDFSEIEGILKQDVSLSYKLLRFLNSAHFGFCERIRSVRQALTLLGVRQLRKWISVTAISGLAKDKPDELIVNSLVRAQMCEHLAEEAGLAKRAQELFLLGMFSQIDAIMDMPMPEVLGRLPLTEDIKMALMGGDSPYKDIYETLLSYEKGNWQRLSAYASKLDIGENRLPALYHASVKWVNDILRLRPSATPEPEGLLQR